MKKKSIVKITAAVFFLAVIFLVMWFWNRGRRIHFLEYENASTIDRAVVYYSGGRTFETTFTEQKDIQKIIQYFQSMQLKKSVYDNVDGFLTEIVLSRGGEDKYSITIRGDEHISVDGVMYDGFYKGDRDYGDGYRLLFEELTGQNVTPGVIAKISASFMKSFQKSSRRDRYLVAGFRVRTSCRAVKR